MCRRETPRSQGGRLQNEAKSYEQKNLTKDYYYRLAMEEYKKKKISWEYAQQKPRTSL
jgi:hypothetical protein